MQCAQQQKRLSFPLETVPFPLEICALLSLHVLTVLILHDRFPMTQPVTCQGLCTPIKEN